MTWIFALIGILVGAAVGIAIGFTVTYSGVNKYNTIGGEGNPELPPELKASRGARIFLTVFGLLWLAGGMALLYFGATHIGMSGSELAQAMGPGTHVASSASGGTFVVVGLFMGFIGGGIAVNGITGK